MLPPNYPYLSVHQTTQPAGIVRCCFLVQYVPAAVHELTILQVDQNQGAALSDSPNILSGEGVLGGADGNTFLLDARCIKPAVKILHRTSKTNE